jgi:hypothetical protein
MKATLYPREKNGSKQTIHVYEFEDAEWERLKADWLSHADKGLPTVGAYQCRVVIHKDTTEARELLIRFDDIAGFG